MLNNDTERNAMRAHRKPVVAVARSREKIAKATEGVSLLTRKREAIVRRPVNANTIRTPRVSSRSKVEPVVKVRTISEPKNDSQVQSTTRIRETQVSQDSNISVRNEQIQRVNARMSQRREQIRTANDMPRLARYTAQEIKQQAISQALAKTARKQPSKTKKMAPVHFGFKRIILATLCAAVAVFAIVYFVNLNAPNISLKVAAMQSGIEASYPAYVPRDYALSDITSEDGKIVLNFKNSATGGAFMLVEEKSSWDSNALLNNYVRESYGDNYTLIREQGLALYVSNSDATWVNGGVVYKLKTTSGTLTKKQIKSIAVSL